MGAGTPGVGPVVHHDHHLCRPVHYGRIRWGEEQQYHVLHLHVTFPVDQGPALLASSVLSSGRTCPRRTGCPVGLLGGIHHGRRHAVGQYHGVHLRALLDPPYAAVLQLESPPWSE
jgi:hypothetical protein